MIGLNLHAAVRGFIKGVHPDEDVVLYPGIGQVNIKGVVKAKYDAPKQVKANIQPLDARTLAHLERLGDTKASEQIFIFSDSDMPISAGSRLPITRTGDIIKRDDGTYWLITSIIEDWSKRGWVNAGIVMQLTPPDFAASDWVGDDDESFNGCQ